MSKEVLVKALRDIEAGEHAEACAGLRPLILDGRFRAHALGAVAYSREKRGDHAAARYLYACALALGLRGKTDYEEALERCEEAHSESVALVVVGKKPGRWPSPLGGIGGIFCLAASGTLFAVGVAGFATASSSALTRVVENFLIVPEDSLTFSLRIGVGLAGAIPALALSRWAVRKRKRQNSLVAEACGDDHLGRGWTACPACGVRRPRKKARCPWCDSPQKVERDLRSDLRQGTLKDFEKTVRETLRPLPEEIIMAERKGRWTRLAAAHALLLALLACAGMATVLYHEPDMRERWLGKFSTLFRANGGNGAPRASRTQADDDMRMRNFEHGDSQNSFIAEQAGEATTPPYADLKIGVNALIEEECKDLCEKYGVRIADTGSLAIPYPVLRPVQNKVQQQIREMFSSRKTPLVVLDVSARSAVSVVEITGPPEWAWGAGFMLKFPIRVTWSAQMENMKRYNFVFQAFDADGERLENRHPDFNGGAVSYYLEDESLEAIQPGQTSSGFLSLMNYHDAIYKVASFRVLFGEAAKREELAEQERNRDAESKAKSVLGNMRLPLSTSKIRSFFASAMSGSTVPISPNALRDVYYEEFEADDPCVVLHLVVDWTAGGEPGMVYLFATSLANQLKNGDIRGVVLEVNDRKMFSTMAEMVEIMGTKDLSSAQLDIVACEMWRKYGEATYRLALSGMTSIGRRQ